MSKSTVLDKIKNPDVPGLEESLPRPPPPPPPPPPIPPVSFPIPGSASNVDFNNSSNLVAYPIPNQTYYPSMIGPPQPPQTNDPWWTPNETDSEVYSQWYENAYKAALQAASDKDTPGKGKVKYFKKKQEIIDPKTDAERVATAQKELSALMKPLKCDLCNAVMNSTLQAKLHYQGKPHQKKVSMYLNQSAKKLKTEDGQVTSTTNDWNSYCETCKIWFTSVTDATQHYAGKKHMKAAYGTTNPKTKKPSPTKNQIDPTGRYGIGMEFLPPPPELPVTPVPMVPEVVSPVVVPPVVVPPIPQYTAPLVAYPTPLRCDICNISVNRQDQLDTHKRGAKHMKMLKLHGLPVPQTNSSALATPSIDYSIHRTPSGQYYCAPCNLSLNSEAVFAQHVESKKHKSQVNPKQQASAQSGSAAKRIKKEVRAK